MEFALGSTKEHPNYEDVHSYIWRVFAQQYYDGREHTTSTKLTKEELQARFGGVSGSSFFPGNEFVVSVVGRDPGRDKYDVQNDRHHNLSVTMAPTKVRGISRAWQKYDKYSCGPFDYFVGLKLNFRHIRVSPVEVVIFVTADIDFCSEWQEQYSVPPIYEMRRLARYHTGLLQMQSQPPTDFDTVIRITNGYNLHQTATRHLYDASTIIRPTLLQSLALNWKTLYIEDDDEENLQYIQTKNHRVLIPSETTLASRSWVVSRSNPKIHYEDKK